MTEDEAKQRWCPFARVDFVGPKNDTASFNRMGGAFATNPVPAGSTCIASLCMAWRHVPAGRRENIAVYEGYCGLAGSPQ